MSKYISTELEIAVARLRAKARSQGVPAGGDEGSGERRRGWDPAEPYEPADVGTAISNAVRASRRLAGRRK